MNGEVVRRGRAASMPRFLRDAERFALDVGATRR
jgi:hypothetical protein